MANVPSYDSDIESSPRTTPLPSVDENDDPMYDLYRPDLSMRNAMPVLSRVNAINDRRTTSNDSVADSDSSDSERERESFMFDSDTGGGRRRRRKTHRRRKTYRRRKTHRRKTHRRRKTYRRRRH